MLQTPNSVLVKEAMFEISLDFKVHVPATDSLSDKKWKAEYFNSYHRVQMINQ